jgi:hypothetical protein
MNFELISSSLRKFVVFTLFLSFPFLVYKKDNLYKFIHIIFPISFFIIFSQFFQLFTGIELYYYIIGEGELSIIQLNEAQGAFNFIRAMSRGVNLILFSFIFSLFLIEKKNYPGKKLYLYLVLIVSASSILMSATRGWIIMFIVIFLMYVIFVAEKNTILLMRLTLIFLLLFSSYYVIPRYKYSIEYSMNRLRTIGYLVQGDVTAGGTLQRIDKRLPRVLEGWKQNPLFGWGFSETYQKYRDFHVGTFNLLHQVGIIGFILFVILWIYYLRMIFFTRKKISNLNVFNKPLQVLLIAFLGLLVLQFTTFVFFAYDFSSPVAPFTIIFLCFSEFFVKEALKEERLKKNLESYKNNKQLHSLC